MFSSDSRGLELSTTSVAAVVAYRSGVDLLLSLWPGAADALRQATEFDPDFALAHAALARQYAIAAQMSEAKTTIAHAKLLVERHGTARERSHVNALFLAINSAGPKALAAVVEHISSWPRDILIFGLPLGAFGLFAFSGMADHDQARVDYCERHARHFADSDWWFLTYRGWSHAENGNVHYGRALTEQALEHRRENANAAHAFAHVLHESGASSEALTFISAWLPSYDQSAILHGHIAWHGALSALEEGDSELAIGWYDRHVAPNVSAGTPVNIVSDSASFLWRLQAYGHEVPSGRWQEAADYASNYFQQPGFPFADLHMSMIAAATENSAALDQRIHKLESLVQHESLPAGPVAPALCRAMQAFAIGDYSVCAELLERFAGEVVRLGGSGAQREIVEDTLFLSLVHQGETEKARLLLDKRLHRRHSTKDIQWMKRLSLLQT
ncbi:tetratricopeptide repeat protein [Pseudomonas sp. NPDC089422]|uniref:tetratricopeptide repeat protein n=1 Tax=Pseudomonas sp. NPDC089422 TaxID=3364466 RepID=UPI00380F5C14